MGWRLERKEGDLTLLGSGTERPCIRTRELGDDASRETRRYVFTVNKNTNGGILKTSTILHTAIRTAQVRARTAFPDLLDLERKGNYAIRGSIAMLLEDSGGRKKPLLPSLKQLIMADSHYIRFRYSPYMMRLRSGWSRGFR